MDLVNVFRPFVLGLDALLRHLYRIQEFDDNEECFFRLSISRSKREYHLSDGVVILPGDRLGEIHFWNERLPKIGENGADVAWARAFYRRGVSSMKSLAANAIHNPEYQDILAYHGDPPIGGYHDEKMLVRALQRWGFDLCPTETADGFWGKFAEFWANLYISWVVWAFNPGSLKGRTIFKLKREEILISRKKLLELYLEKQKTGTPEFY